jgi:hypothetical protein
MAHISCPHCNGDITEFVMNLTLSQVPQRERKPPLTTEQAIDKHRRRDERLRREEDKP